MGHRTAAPQNEVGVRVRRWPLDTKGGQPVEKTVPNVFLCITCIDVCVCVS